MQHVCGEPVEECPAGLTGPNCELTCDWADGENCSYREYCHRDGRTAGVLGLGAFLFGLDGQESDGSVFGDLLKGWLAAHPSVVGLRDDLRAGDLDLEFWKSVSHGSLFTAYFTQRYRGLPLLGSESIVVLSGPKDRVSLIRGSIVDNAENYEHYDEQCPASTAEASLLYHASDYGGGPIDQLAVSELRLYGVPSLKRVVWGGDVVSGTVSVGFYAVSADPNVDESEIAKLVYKADEPELDLSDETSIEAYSHDLSASPYGWPDVTYTVNDQIAGGLPLLGSTYDGEVQLATGRVFVRDLNGHIAKEIHLAGQTRITSKDGSFLSDAGAEFNAQRYYHIFQGLYEITDRFLAVPTEPELRQWDSLKGDESGFAAGTFQPRVVIFARSGECAGAVGCAQSLPVDVGNEGDDPEFYHRAEGAVVNEPLGAAHFRENAQIKTITHEFGHVADIFLYPGMSQGMICVDCPESCKENTSDEAPPLKETIAQLFSLLYFYSAWSSVDETDCQAVQEISSNGTYAETPGPCMADLGQVAYLVRDEDCPVGAGFCDKPDDVEKKHVCCTPGPDDPECIANNDCNSGGKKSVPTGLCGTADGYRTNSAFEAFWQLLVGSVCSPLDPYTCTPIELPEEVDPLEAAARAFFYSLRTGPESYEELFDRILAYYSCEYGEDAFLDVQEIFCNHLIVDDCTEPPPMQCYECGNGILEPGEACDLTQVTETCESMGYDGGVVKCTTECKVSYEECFYDMTSSSSEATGESISTGESLSTGDSMSGGDSETTTAGPEEEGCGCRAGLEDSDTSWGFGCAILLVGTLRRRRRR